MQEAIKQALDIDIQELNPTVAERARIPIRIKDLVVRHLVDRRHAEFMGGVMHGVPPLLYRITKECIRMPGRLNRNSLNSMVQENSFMGEVETKPWATLLANESTMDLAKGITAAWEYLQQEITDKMVELEQGKEGMAKIQLLNNDIESAGFTNKIKVPQ